jgi:hypothetical protein
MSIDSHMLYEVDAALEQWDDMRVIHIDDLRALLIFWKYVPTALSQSGIRFCGYQLRQRDGQYLLVVKGKQNGTPLVVFLSSATTTGCVRLFVSQLSEDRLSWHHDKFPWG